MRNSPSDPGTYDSTLDPAQLPEAAAVPERRGYSLLLVIGLALTLAAIWTAFLEHSSFERRQAVAATLEHNALLTVVLDQYATRVLRQAEAVTQFVAREYEKGARGELLQQVVSERARHNEVFSEVAVTGPAGEMLASSRSPATAPVAGVLRAQAGDAVIAVGNPLPVGPGQEVLVPISRAIRDARGAVVALAVLYVDSRRLVLVFDESHIRQDTLVVLAMPDGTPVAAWGGEQRGPVAVPPRLQQVAQLLQHAAANADSPTVLVDGVPRFVSAHRMGAYPLVVAAGTEARDALADTALRQRWYFRACLAVSLMLALLTAVLLRMNWRRDRMDRTLARVRQRLSDLNADLEHQVLERTTQLEAANRDLESFSYSVAHDVRAPLATIDSFSQILEPPIAATGDAKLVHYLQRIRASSRQMGELTDSLLSLATLSRQPVHRARVDLSALAHTVAQGLRERAPGRGVTLHIQPGLWADADRTLARQVLENLLGNAWKFTAGRDAAVVEVGQAPPDAQGEGAFFVRDNGAGFDMDYAGKLFQPFQRLHSQAEFPGTGVGLATVHRIVALHGGRVWAEGAAGQGATVYFTLAP